MNGKYSKMHKEIMQREVYVNSYNCLGLKQPNSLQLSVCCDMMDLKKEFAKWVSTHNMCVFSKNVLKSTKINYNNTNILFDDTQIRDFDDCQHRFRLDFPKLIGIRVLSVTYIYCNTEKMKPVLKEIKKLSGIDLKLNFSSTPDAVLEHHFRLGINDIDADGSVRNTNSDINFNFDF